MTVAAGLTIGSSAKAEMIHLMARKGDVSKVMAEIDKGVPVDLPSTKHTNLIGSSPLFVASRFGKIEVVAALLEAGADPNFRRPDYMGENTYGSPLITAASNGHTDVVKLLLAAGADPAITDPSLGPPLHVARIRGNIEIEALLLEQGVPQSTHLPADPELLRNADTERGRLIAGGCGLCHLLRNSPQGEPKEGPNLWGIVGRPKASADGYDYSPYMRQKGGTWSYDDLNSFLSSTYEFVPGTKMVNRGLPEARDRADVIAYLRTLSSEPVPLP